MGTLTQVAAQQTQHAGRLIFTFCAPFVTSIFISLNRVYCRRHKYYPHYKHSSITVLLASIVFYSGSILAAPIELPDQCSAPDGSPSLAPLAIKYQTLVGQLKTSDFGEPIILNSETGKDFAQGEVYAVLNTPFFVLDDMLSQPAQWCALAILHQNIKTCTYGKNPTGNDELKLYVGRKYYQEPTGAFAAQYQFSIEEKDPFTFNATLSAPKGPLGTRNYLIQLEAIAIDDKRSFIHFTYRYQYGLIADIAMRTYLSTIGRNKVGFTVTGTNGNGEPIYIKGLQGVVERNVMRYIFAIQSILDTKDLPEKIRQKAQFAHWYNAISKHRRQLVELSNEEYLNNKKQELKNQQQAQIYGVEEEE